MRWKWVDRVEPRPNVRVVDAHEMPLRGEVEEEDHSEAVIVYVFAAFLIGGIVGTIAAVTQ